MEAVVAHEIEGAVKDALALFGTYGSVHVRGRQIELRGRGAPVVIDIENLGEQWPLLPHDLRARKAGDIARRLAQAQRAVSSLVPPGVRSAAPPPRLIVIPIGVVVLVILGAFFGLRLLRARTPPPAPSQVAVESNDEAAARHARVCEAARKRIYSGASIGPFEVEGWVTELWLASPRKGAAGAADAGASAAALGLDAFIAEGKLTPGADVELAALHDGRVEVAPGLADEDASGSPGWTAAIVRLSGGYARGYFDPALRPRFLSLAERMADAASADLGALYVRCSHLRFHDGGAWFRGADAPLAAVAVVYGAGFFAELPAVNRGAVKALGGPGQLDALRTAGKSIDASLLGRLVGAQGGGISTNAAGAVSLVFPASGMTRATSASRVIARKLGVGVGQD